MSKKPSKSTEQEKPKTRYDRKMEARRKEAAREKRNSMIFRIICIAIVVAIVGTAGYFGVTKYLDYRTATKDLYLSVGDHQLTKLEYDYYFNTTVNNYVNTYSYYLSYIGLDTTQPFDEQQYSEDMTWQEYFEEATITQIQQEYALLDDASANAFEYDTSEDYDNFVTNAKTTAKESQVTLQNYYKTLFGDYANQWNVKPFMENSYTASAYYDKLLEDHTPTDDEITDYYEEHKADYDKVSFYSFTFDPANYTETTGEDNAASDDDTTTNSADASTARTLAEEMVSRLEDGEDFEDLCYEYAIDDAKANYESEDAEYSLTEGMTCSSTNISYSDWLSDESRKAGDITIIEDSTTGACYVLKFVSRTYDESCPDTISSTLSTEAVNEYLDALLEGKYEAVDLKGEISYLTSSEEDASESSEDTSDTESLLDTSIIE
ncbi:MAG: hypothetical protein J6B50_04675 [Lachnospiraceae bacterium]|nr:hypothetical protein [Lachnospiraceae bacterium]